MHKSDYSKNKHCKCGKTISNKAVACQSCSKKELYKNPSKNPMFGKHLSTEHKLQIGKSNFKNGLPKCKLCKKEISYGHKRCENCYHKIQIGRKHTLKSKKLMSKAIKHHYKNHVSSLKGKKRPEHSRMMKGKNNPNYVNGISKTGYPCNFRIVGGIVRKRDKHKCRL